ncbi:ABC transporter ATP-binding protein [Nocardioides lianchengensis]|uniref:ATP-binding cassette, subfamily C n=1 Tax=Nocardioides lianchengensis TaxID=1045774 RepID=A0A1G6JLC6_9ACTN|nr:ABC transporter ATP-binding protein [Nocardioides lianchengensis]NYG08710.1 ATP-binding cassette subfamily C protein [Nocardioides lianchengensis]SDC19523.1 ATP-binding cassette, subfamily C [Nocardioides lianchengensis]
MSRDLLPVATARESAGHLLRLMLRRPVVLGAAVAAFLAASATGLLAPYVLGRLVDRLLDGGPGVDDALTSAFWLIAGAAVLGGLLAAGSADLLARAVEPALATLRQQVLARALTLDAARVEASGSGDLLSRVGDDARVVARAVSQFVPMVLASLTTIVLTAGGLFTLDWRLGLAGLVTLPFYVHALRWYLPRSAPYYARERVATGERAQALVSALRGLPTLRSFRIEEPAAAEVDARSADTVRISLDVFHLYGRFGGRTNRTECVGLIAILGVGFLGVDSGAVSVGEVTTAALFFHRLFNPIGVLLFLFDDLQVTAASLTRLVGVAALPAPSYDVPAEPAGGTLALRGIGHRYLPDRPMLDGVDLVVEPGRRVALVGASGAGKTTLAAVAAGVLPPTSGSVRLGSVDLGTLDPALLRRQVGLVSQEVHVFAGTLRDNLRLAAVDDPSDEDLHEALVAVAAAGWVAALPEGLDTLVGEDGRTLTPAQAQQLALARVLLVDPAVVVLDEATAEAGSLGARELDTAADAVTRGRAALVVAHRLSQAQRSDLVLVLDHGRVVESGSHDELVAAGGRYAELWAAWESPTG